jgi:1,4-dihydroxy-2-naphthoyl-CoA hydrolase
VSDAIKPDPGAYVKWLGVEMLEASGDKVVAAWDVRPDMHQPYGIVHGGVYCSVIETVASYAAALWFTEGQVVGVSNQTDFLRAVRDGRLTATATPIHRGRLQQLWVVDIQDETPRTVARGQVRLQNLPANRI